MSGLAFLLLPLLVAVGVIVGASRVVERRRVLLAEDAAALPGLLLLRRASVTSRLVAAVLGIAVAALVASQDSCGRGLALAPAVFAAVQVLGTIVAEVVTHDAARHKGRAGLEPRRAGDYSVPHGLRGTVVITATLLAATLIWTSAVASPDDLGRAGRSYTSSCGPDCTAVRGPWPGSFYSVPLGLALGVVLVLAAAAVWLVVKRPRNGADPVLVRLDDVIRRRSLESVLASLGVGVGGTLAGVSAVVALALAGGGSVDLPLAVRALGWVALAAAGSGFALTVWSLVVLALPGAGAVRTPVSPPSQAPAPAAPEAVG